MFGALVETAVVSAWVEAFVHRGEVPSLYFWRTRDGIEADLLVERNGRLYALEVKSTSTILPAHAVSLAKWRKLAGQPDTPCVILAPVPSRRRGERLGRRGRLARHTDSALRARRGATTWCVPCQGETPSGRDPAWEDPAQASAPRSATMITNRRRVAASMRRRPFGTSWSTVHPAAALLAAAAARFLDGVHHPFQVERGRLLPGREVAEGLE